MDISVLWSVPPQTLALLILIVTIETLGITQAIKGRWIFKNRSAVLLSFLSCVLCGIMQSHYVSAILSSIFNIVFCAFAVSTIAAQGMLGLVKSIPKMFEKVLVSKVEVAAIEAAVEPSDR
jgi:hypothetical protein